MHRGLYMVEFAQSEFTDWYLSKYSSWNMTAAARDMGVSRQTWATWLTDPNRIEKATPRTRAKFYAITGLECFNDGQKQTPRINLKDLATVAGSLGVTLTELSDRLTDVPVGNIDPSILTFKRSIYALIRTGEHYVKQDRRQREEILQSINGADVGYLVTMLSALFGNDEDAFQRWKSTASFTGKKRMEEILREK